MASEAVLLRTCEIYGWICPLTKAIVYVGKTSAGISRRMTQHRTKSLRKPKTRAERWMRRRLRWDLVVTAKRLAVCSVAASSRVERDWIETLSAISPLLNERVGGNGNPGVGRVDWTPQRLARLGTKPDYVIAAEIGCDRGTVTYRRSVLGIAKCPQDFTPITIALSEAIIRRLGTCSDRTLGAEIGVSKFVIAKNRKRLGIPSYAETTGNDGRIKSGDPHKQWELMPEWAVAKLGLVQDYLLAQELGWTVVRVGTHRRQAGIAVKRARKWERSDLAGLPRKRRSDAGRPRTSDQRRVPGEAGLPAGAEGQI